MHYIHSVYDIVGCKRMTPGALKSGDTYVPLLGGNVYGDLRLVLSVSSSDPCNPDNNESHHISVLRYDGVHRHLVSAAYFWEA